MRQKSLEVELIDEFEHLLNSLMQPLEPPQGFVHDLRHRLDTTPHYQPVCFPPGFFASVLYILLSVVSSALLVAVGIKGLHILKERWQQPDDQAPAAFTRGQA